MQRLKRPSMINKQKQSVLHMQGSRIMRAFEAANVFGTVNGAKSLLLPSAVQLTALCRHHKNTQTKVLVPSPLSGIYRTPALHKHMNNYDLLIFQGTLSHEWLICEDDHI